MKVQHQFFCQCGKGRIFFMANGRKAEVESGYREFLVKAKDQGWSDLNEVRQSAQTCNHCNKK